MCFQGLSFPEFLIFARGVRLAEQDWKTALKKEAKRPWQAPKLLYQHLILSNSIKTSMYI